MAAMGAKLRAELAKVTGSAGRPGRPHGARSPRRSEMRELVKAFKSLEDDGEEAWEQGLDACCVACIDRAFRRHRRRSSVLPRVAHAAPATTPAKQRGRRPSQTQSPRRASTCAPVSPEATERRRVAGSAARRASSPATSLARSLSDQLLAGAIASAVSQMERE